MVTNRPKAEDRVTYQCLSIETVLASDHERNMTFVGVTAHFHGTEDALPGRCL
jgi:hypothetical protein